jgi:hypothetical protein
MALRYVEVDEEKLHAILDGLGLIEQVRTVAGSDHLDLCLYGVTHDAGILDAAKEAIADEMNDADVPGTFSEKDVNLTEIAVAIPLSSDVLYALLGSGLKLKKENFVYPSPDEGLRELNFRHANFQAVANAKKFSTMAIGESDAWLDSFFKQFATQPKPAPEVRRNEEAILPTSAIPEAAPKEIPPPISPKKTSLKTKFNIASALDEFLG